MTLLIRTYSNPYRIDKENYWNTIKDCFHLCSSQTLVNGLVGQYFPVFEIGKLTTFGIFLKHLYDDWDGNKRIIQQRAAIDNIITTYDFSKYSNGSLKEDDIKNSLRLNRTALCQSIKTMFELDIEKNEAIPSELSVEQKCMFDIYEELKKTANKAFELPQNFKEKDIDYAIDLSIKYAIDHSNRKNDIKIDKSEIRHDSIVIHGVHQFTPLMLRAIEELSKYKLVVLLFNYVPGFKNVYQTWLNVYEYFESIKDISSFDYSYKDTETPGRAIANEIKAVLEQDFSIEKADFADISVLEFDNTTEFAGYIAKRFQEAEQAQRADNYKISRTLYYMDEQFYAADSSVNEILKIYFPRQFNERQFLDYPIGHFFIAMTEMWDPETGELRISDLESIKECLSSGILREMYPGELLSVLRKTELALNNENTISGMIRKLNELKAYNHNVLSTGLDEKEALRIGYLTVSKSEIDALITGLNEFDRIADYFFADFNNDNNDFKAFYHKIKQLLLNVMDTNEIAEEFRDVLSRVLEQLKEVEDIDANATFDCLRETMQLYLQQIPLEGGGAHWIAKNFEQIDGDVLRQIKQGSNRIYHFACISDSDMISDRNTYSWPLDQFFFDHALNPIDWKYRVYISSKQEYKNFRRYALVYGLLFGTGNIQLSYIKNKNDQVQDLYYLFRILNAKVERYTPDRERTYLPKTSEISFKNEVQDVHFSSFDVNRFELCPARFLYETISTDDTVYKSEYLITQYLKVLLEKYARLKYGGKSFSEKTAYKALSLRLDQISNCLPFIRIADKMDILRSVSKKLEKDVTHGQLRQNSKSNRTKIALKEVFLTDTAKDSKGNEILRDVSQTEIDERLNHASLADQYFNGSINKTCSKCPESQYCLNPYRYKSEDER